MVCAFWRRGRRRARPGVDWGTPLAATLQTSYPGTGAWERRNNGPATTGAPQEHLRKRGCLVPAQKKGEKVTSNMPVLGDWGGRQAQKREEVSCPERQFRAWCP